MKKFLGVVVFLLILNSVVALNATEPISKQALQKGVLWIPSGDDIHNTNEGSVGIATTTPNAKLHISREPSQPFDPAVLLDNANYYGVENTEGEKVRLIGLSGINDVFLGSIDDAGGKVFIREDGTNVIAIDNEKVGIGTENPAYTLDVNGAAIIRGNVIRRDDGTALLAGDESSTKIVADDGRELRFFTDNSGVGGERVRIDASGNVGIGTTNPEANLHIIGTSLAIEESEDKNKAISLSDTTSGKIWQLTHKQQSEDNSFRILYNDGSSWNNIAHFGTNGNVGIGTTTPPSKLTLSNNVATGSLDEFSEYQVLLYESRLPQESYGIGIRSNTFVLNSDSDFDFDQDGNTVMSIANGNVGIGTDPSQKLDVAGYVKGQSGLCIGTDCRTSWPAGGGDDGDWQFSGNNIYRASGNVGIGPSNPGAPLHILNSNAKIVLEDTDHRDFYIAANHGNLYIGKGIDRPDEDIIVVSADERSVGIGTDSPQGKLDVRSTGSGQRALFVKAGSADSGVPLWVETSGGDLGAIKAKSSGTTIYGETWGEGAPKGSTTGVWGLAAASVSRGGATLGVLGESRAVPLDNSDTSAGVFGWGNLHGGQPSGPNRGRTYGVWAETNSKGHPAGESCCASGVYGAASNTEAGMNAMGVIGRTSKPSGESFGVYYSGGISGVGSSSSIVPTDGGPRNLYTVHSTENWFEDFGSGKLSEGVTRIEIDEIFLETITVDNQNQFMVFVTPTGENAENGMRVIKDETGFSVEELNGGTSDATFDYRIVAKRKGYEQQRLEISEVASTDPLLHAVPIEVSRE